MIPDYTAEFTTEGERRFFEFLSAFAKPDQKYTSWYLPEIGGREPDFILYCEDLGLIVFEVKDWSLEQIEEADPHAFVLRLGKKTRRVKSPLQQAREYLNSLMDRIKADGKLVSRDPKHYGKPKIPIDCGVVFPNINKRAYCGKGLERVIDTRHIFFRDDLHSGSEICSDESGQCFQAKLVNMFPPRFSFRLSGDEYGNLKQLLFPVIRVNHSMRDDACIYMDPTRRVHVLDDRQESIARRFVPEVNLICGPAGSGKSLVLVHRAALLKAYRPEFSVLFLCRNPALVNYLKRLFLEKKTGLGPAGVEVYHFSEVCAKVLGEQVDLENEGDKYRRVLVKETLAELKRCPKKYDAVFIDEGQDFSEGMIQVAAEFLNRGSPWLTVAVDETKDLQDWDGFPVLAGLSENPRIDYLAVNYRNTAEIRQFASNFSGLRSKSESICEFNGPQPELVRVVGAEAAASYVSDTIRTLYNSREYPLSEIAILYAARMQGKRRFSVPELMVGELEARGIMADWISEDYRAKLSFDITTDRVCIASFENAKGLDWASVFILGLDEDEPSVAATYTALTRARHRLLIPYAQINRTIETMIDASGTTRHA